MWKLNSCRTFFSKVYKSPKSRKAGYHHANVENVEGDLTRGVSGQPNNKIALQVAQGLKGYCNAKELALLGAGGIGRGGSSGVAVRSINLAFDFA